MIHIKSFKSVGAPDPAGLSRVYEFSGKELGFESEEKLTVVFSTKTNPADLEEIEESRNVIKNLFNDYFKGEKSLVLLKSAVIKAFEKLSGIWVGVSISAVAIDDKRLHAVSVGGSSVFIYRNGATARLTGGGDAPEAVSGKLENGDILFCGTDGFFELFGKNEVVNALKTEGVSGAGDAFSGKIFSLGMQGNIALLILEIGGIEHSVQKIDGETLTEAKLTREEATKVSWSSNLGALFKGWGRRINLPKFKKNANKVTPERRLKFPLADGPPVRRDLRDLDGRAKKPVFAGVVALGILVLLVLLGTQNRQKGAVNDEIERALYGAEIYLQNAISAKENDKETAYENLELAGGVLADLEARGMTNDKTSQLKETIDKEKGEVLGARTFNLEKFWDLTIVTDNFEGDEISFDGKNVYVLDKEIKVIIVVNLETKKTSTVAGPSRLNNPEMTAFLGGNVYVLEGEGVYLLRGSERDAQKVTEKDWKDKAFLQSFATSLYVLDKDSGEIIKYQSASSADFEKSNWLTGGENSFLKSAVDFAIDGTVWAVSKDKIARFNLGQPMGFSYENPYPKFEEIAKIYTDENTDKILILEPGLSRVVALGKDGKFMGQYTHEDFGSAVDIVYYGQTSSVFVLSSGKLYSFSI
jgi:hypothetical protein